MNKQRLIYGMLIALGVLIGLESTRSAWQTYRKYETLRQLSLQTEVSQWLRYVEQTHTPQDFDIILEEHKKNGLHWLLKEKHGDQGYLSAGQPTLDIAFVNDLNKRGMHDLPNGRVTYIQPIHASHLPRYITTLPGAPRGFKSGYGPPIMAIEFTPHKTNAMIRRAQLQLALSILAGILVMLFCFGLVWLLNQREKLRQQEQQQRLYAALGDLSTTISHELQHPLQSTLQRARRIQSKLDQPRMHKRAGRLSNEVHRLIEITQSLIEFVDSGRINPKPHTISDALKTLQARIEGTTIHWPQHTSKQAIHIDLVMFERALSNIIRNAQQIAPDKAIKITSSIEDNHWHLNIRDHGPGFPDGFDPFEPFASKRRGGHGLGLAMTSEIILAHNGTITARNHAQTGAIFHVQMPLS